MDIYFGPYVQIRKYNKDWNVEIFCDETEWLLKWFSPRLDVIYLFPNPEYLNDCVTAHMYYREEVWNPNMIKEMQQFAQDFAEQLDKIKISYDIVWGVFDYYINRFPINFEEESDEN